MDSARQSLGRSLTEPEVALATALEQIFATGEHDLAQTASKLQQLGVARPSGSSGAWSLQVLEQELRSINQSLDDAYLRGGQPA